jgi:hypothetical protein
MTIASLYPTISPTLDLQFANTTTLDPRVTFSRASTGTYYDGKTVAKAEENLLLQSQNFSDAVWVVANSAAKGGAVTAPDGSSTARELTLQTISDSQLYQSVNVISGATYTLSIWMRAQSGTPTVGLGGISGASEVKTLSTTWTRYSVTQVASSGNRFPRIVRDGADVTIEIWGAQLEQRSTATAYTPTTTQPITNYIPVLLTAAAGVARFDHNPTTSESLGLLIEEQRTNLLTYSEDFADAAWTKNTGVITANSIISPDGNLTADVYTQNNGTTGELLLTSSVSVTANTDFTISGYFKSSGGGVGIQLYSTASGNGFLVKVNLLTGTIVSAGPVGAGTYTASSLTNVGNGWYRVSVTGRLATGVTTGQWRVSLRDSSGNGASGNGWLGFAVWGAQLEAGAFPTSYIPTVASQVTRSADSASMTGSNFSSWYRADEGTLYGESSVPYPVAYTGRMYYLGSTPDAISLYRQSDNQPVMRVQANSTDQALLGFGAIWTTSNVFKTAQAYKVNDFAGSVNAGSVLTDSSGIVPSVSVIYIGNQAGASFFNGYIKRIAYYPKRLSNTELQGITS